MDHPLVQYVLNLDPVSMARFCDLQKAIEYQKKQGQLQPQGDSHASRRRAPSSSLSGNIRSTNLCHYETDDEGSDTSFSTRSGRISLSSSMASSSQTTTINHGHTHQQPRKQPQGQQPQQQQQQQQQSPPDKLALPRVLLAKVIDSLLTSGLEKQQALASEICLALDEELMTAAKAKNEQAGQSEGRRHSFSHRATASTINWSGSSSSSSSSTTTTTTTAITAAAHGRNPSIPERIDHEDKKLPPADQSTLTNEQSDPITLLGMSSPSSMSAASSTPEPLTSGSSAWEGSSSDSSGDTDPISVPVAHPAPSNAILALTRRPSSTLALRPATAAFWASLSTAASSAARQEWPTRRGGGRRARRRGTEIYDAEDDAWILGTWDMEELEVRNTGSKPGALQAKVMSTFKAMDEKGNEYMQYRLRVSQGGCWTAVDKRYSEFVELATTLLSSGAHDKELSRLAPKKPWLSFGSAIDPKVTEERKQVIGSYLSALLDRPQLRANPKVQEFLGYQLHLPEVATK